jgi:hypothetical protein
MGVTKQIPRREWKAYFEGFTRQYVDDQSPEAVTIEVVSPTLGDQLAAEGARLLGFTYDPKSNAFEVLVEGIDHLAYEPTEIWAIEDEDGFVSEIEVVEAGGTKDLFHVRRDGPPARRHDQPLPPQG